MAKKPYRSNKIDRMIMTAIRAYWHVGKIYCTPEDIVMAVDFNPEKVQERIYVMTKAGRIHRIKRGVYSLRKPSILD